MSDSNEFRKVQRQLSTIFLVLLLAGATLTFANKWLPVLAVVTYATIGWFLTKPQKNSERFADSLYYLGFLLTLFSLFAATLNEAEATSSIISNLGTGLSTTLAGLALRVVVLQFRDTVSDQEEEAKESLDAAVARMVEVFETLNTRVGKLSQELEAVGTTAVSTIRELSQSAEAARVEVARLPASASAIVLPAAEEMSRSIREVYVPPDVVVQEVQRLFSGISDAGKGATQALDLLTQSISGAQGEASRIVTVLADDVARMTADIQTKIDSVDLTPVSRLNEQVQILVKATGENVAALGGAGQSVQSVYEQHAKLAGQFQSAVQGSIDVVGRLKRAADEVASIEQLCQAIQLRVERLDGVVAGVDSSGGMLIRTVEDAAKNVGEVKSATAALVSFVNRRQ